MIKYTIMHTAINPVSLFAASGKIPVHLTALPIDAAKPNKLKALGRLCTYIEGYTGFKISDNDFAILGQHTIFKLFRRRQYLLQEGDVCQYLSFTISGALRMYSVNERGQEATLSFSLENNWIADRESLGLQLPTVFNIEAVENTEVIQIPIGKLELLSQSIFAFATMIRLQTRELAIETQKRIHTALSMTAEERYHELLETKPEYTQRFSQNMVASYLGIKPETLSRLRKR